MSLEINSSKLKRNDSVKSVQIETLQNINISNFWQVHNKWNKVDSIDSGEGSETVKLIAL